MKDKICYGTKKECQEETGCSNCPQLTTESKEKSKIEILSESIYELKDLKESILELVSELSKINKSTDTIKVSWIIKEICDLGKPDLKKARSELLKETDKDKERLAKRRARSSLK